MTTVVGLIFILLVVYQLKHLLADYVFQGRYMLGKFKGGMAYVLPLLAHVGVHGLGTFYIASFTVSLTGTLEGTAVGLFALHLALIDAGIHFIMDRIKASPNMLGRFKPLFGKQYVEDCRIVYEVPDRAHPLAYRMAKNRLRGNTYFWWSLGLDQMVHHLTHYLLIYLMLRTMGMVR